MDAFAGKVINGLSSLALEEFNLLRDLGDDKRWMEDTVSAINAALLHVEANATSDQVKDWLDKLKDVLYDADDLLDDFSAESLARKVRNRNKLAEKVCTFCSKSNQIAYGHKMSRRMKAIRKKFDDIADNKKKLKLVADSSKPPVGVKERRQTHPSVCDEEVIGREEEKNLLKSFLLNTNQSNNVSIITIVGFGGLGKTTLADFLYKDADVQSHFELKMWVCVSDQFDITEIGQKMVECTKDDSKQQVQEKIREKIQGMRYLLVLDDMWNEDRMRWVELRNLLMEGGKGSMIIVTTRIAKVKRIMDANFPLDLKGLDDENSWKFFSQVAFEGGKEPDIPKLVAIGKEITQKCVGIPLALKTIGSLLYGEELTESVWSYFRDSDLLRIDQENNNDILPILELSYNHLSSNLKNCFAYCSLFPKGYKIKRETLIQLWIAQGFIPLSNQGRHPEDVGHEYFMNLLSRSFFQNVERNDFGDISTCKMHDLMHDLATLKSKNECMVVKEGNRANIGDRIRHLSFDVTLEAGWQPPTCLLEAGKLRTFLVPRLEVEGDKETPEVLACLFCCLFCCRWRLIDVELEKRWIGAELVKSVISSLISSLKRMRILDLHGLRIATIPKNIGKLKHLRYLDLSDNNIRKLPKGITRLHNLQTLKLNGCRKLTKLPGDINKLVCLRHLGLDRCWSLNESDSARLSELGGLNNLKGRLSIYGLQQVRGNAAEAESAKLLQKQHLQHLGLYWSDPMDHLAMLEEKDHHRDEMLLQALQPHDSIKSLTIETCATKKLPDWIRNLLSLQQLEIINCDFLEYLSESIGNLSSLQQLGISGCSGLASLPESIGNLSSLQQLVIGSCSGLASLPESIGNLSSLQQLLRIYSCNCLASLPESIGNLSSLQQLEISSCSGLASLPESIGNLSSLQLLRIYSCNCLASLPESIGNLSSLQRLEIIDCPGLASLPESIGNLSSLQHLDLSKCHNLASLPDGMRDIRSLQSLWIYRCPLLGERCKREEGEDWPKIARVPSVSIH